MKIQVEEVAYHRNGISGEGFHVVTFRWAEQGEEPRHMVGIIFGREGQCAVLDREQTRQGNIAFAMGNSWRGDHFEHALRVAIRKAEEGPVMTHRIVVRAEYRDGSSVREIAYTVETAEQLTELFEQLKDTAWKATYGDCHYTPEESQS